MKKLNGSPGNTILAPHLSHAIPFIFIWSKFNWMDKKKYIKRFGLDYDFFSSSIRG